MVNPNLLKARPILVTALDALNALGGRSSVDDWMSSHPDLNALRNDEKGKVIRALHDAGYIERAGWKLRNRKGRDGRSHGQYISVWRVKTWYR